MCIRDRERGKGLTFETVGLDFGTSPFWTKRIPPLLGQKAKVLLGQKFCLNQEPTLADAIEASDDMQIFTRLDAEDDLDGSADESEPESEGGSDAAEESE